MKSRITFNAGTEWDKDGRLIAELPVAVMTVRAMLAQAFGGYTETHTQGGWINGNGELVQEHGLQWVVVSTDPYTGVHEKAEHMARQIAIALNQESVLLQVEEVNAFFIGQPDTIGRSIAEKQS